MALPVGPDEEATASLIHVRRFTGRLGITGGGQALAFVVGIANQIVMSHALGVEAYGQYGIVVASAALLGWFLGLGLNSATPALVRGEPARARTVVTFAGAYLLVLGTCALIAFLRVSPVLITIVSPNLASTTGRWLFP